MLEDHQSNCIIQKLLYWGQEILLLGALRAVSLETAHIIRKWPRLAALSPVKDKLIDLAVERYR